MTNEEQVELSNLGNVLSYQFIENKLQGTKTLDNMIKRYSELIDKFIKKYELPENSVKVHFKN